jgi:hypothetical protein
VSGQRTADGGAQAAGSGQRIAVRIVAWLLTGPVGRVVAFVGDLAVALGGWALRRARLRREGGQ